MVTLSPYWQDSKGFMWFGTRDGLNKYDRLQLNHLQERSAEIDNVVNNVVMDLVEDSEGKFWIATGGGGLDLFDPSTEVFTHFKVAMAASATHISNALYLDKEGICGDRHDARALQVQSETKTFTYLSHDQSPPVASATIT